MTLIPNVASLDWFAFGPRIVGAVFLWTAVIKAITPHTFFRHLANLGWVPNSLLATAVTAAAGLEAGWGVALLLGAAPGVVLPVTLILLCVLSAASWWGVHSGRVSDCGCYGGFIRPSIGQSVGLNFLFACLVVGALDRARDTQFTSVQQLAVLGATLSAVALAAWTQRFNARHGRPLLDTTRLKVGRRWRHSWAGSATRGVNGEVLVSYLGQACPHCQQWVRVLNAVDQSPVLPTVVGVVATSTERLETFVNQRGIRFQMASVSQTLMGHLAEAVPTTVLVDAGRIQRVWVGPMPSDFFERFRAAFFPEAAETSRKERAAPSSVS